MEPHRHEGIFIARGKEDALVTKNLVPGESVYGEKRVSVEVLALPYYLSSMIRKSFEIKERIALTYLSSCKTKRNQL